MREPRFAGKLRGLASYTLVELIVTIGIIAILASLTLYGAHTVLLAGERNRTTTEIAGITSGLEQYKTDNGTYPQTNTFTGTSAYSASDGSLVGGNYANSSTALFQALSGKINFTDTPTTGIKTYLTLKSSQVGSPGANSYILDASGYSYGYNTGSGNTADTYNGLGNFDLWSTGGGTVGKDASWTNSWITNWKQ